MSCRKPTSVGARLQSEIARGSTGVALHGGRVPLVKLLRCDRG